MAYKNDKPAGNGSENQASQGGIFSLTHQLFDYTVDPKYGDILGKEYDLLDQSNFTPEFARSVNYPFQKWRLPGIATFGMMPVWGVGDTKNSPLNLAATSLFKRIQNTLRKTNLKYQSSDIMMQLAAHDSLFMMYNVIKRAYETLSTFNPWNTYVNKYMFTAMGLDYDDFYNNSAQIHYDLVMWANTLKSFPIPTNFPMFGMHSAMMTQFFADVQEDKKYQMMVFMPTYLWKYPTFEGTKPASYELVPVSFYHKSAAYRYADCKRIFNGLLNALITSSDFQEINSNLLSTFEGGTFYSVSPPSVDSGVHIAYDVDVIEAITNLKVVKISGETIAKSWAPKCTANNIIEVTPVVNGLTRDEAFILGASHIINATSDNVDSKRAARTMRWHPTVKDIGYYTNESGVAARIASCGTEIITSMTYLQDSPWYDGFVQAMTLESNLIASDYEGVDTTSFSCAALSAYRFHPTVFVVQKVADGKGELVYYQPLAQWHYSAHLSNSEAQNIHNAYWWQALLSDI